MAEGFLKHLAGDRFEAYSAGVEPTGEIHPRAVEALREVGIDLPAQYPKGLRTYMGKVGFNYLIIVCARAEERSRQTFPGVGMNFSWIFEDPRRVGIGGNLTIVVLYLLTRTVGIPLFGPGR